MSSAALEAQLLIEHGVRLPFFRGTLPEAKKECQAKTRYLLVYLHNSHHETTSPFLAKVLASDALTKLMHEEFLLYGASVAEPDGFALARDLGCTTFPFIALVFKSQVMCTLQGEALLHQATVVSELTRATNTWGSLMAKEISFRHDRELRERARIEEEEAEEEAMQKDRELLAAYEAREKQRKDDEAKRLELEREAQERRMREEAEAAERELALRAKQLEDEEANSRKKEALELERAIALSSVPCPPSDGCDPSSVVCVSIRFRRGTVERKFLFSDDVEGLYNYAVACEEHPGRPFTLMLSGMPPKPIERSPGVPLQRIFGTQRRVAIIVRED